jgi:hypothetical protein
MQEAFLAQDRVGLRKAISPLVKARKSSSRVVPVDPARLVVLAIGVVVAALGIADLVAGKEHGRALAENSVAIMLRRRQRAGGADIGIVGRPSTPILSEKFSLWPSRLSSPLASLWRVVADDIA